MKHKSLKKISKYSSICSRHFLPSDFSLCKSRQFLTKIAVPTVRKLQTPQSIPQEDDEPQEVGIEDPLSDDECSLCRASSNSSFHLVDDYYYGLVRKCLPFTINLSFSQKLCGDCIKNLNNFSSFIDKIISTQNLSTNVNFPEIAPVINRNIKVEPTTNFENEVKIPSIHVIDFTQQSQAYKSTTACNSFMPPKKCEILEIVDIKPFMEPFHFDGGMQQENYDDEDDIQILSPKQLKVELTDPDEDGSNELELIRNYVFISTVFLQDHNYVKNETLDNIESNVKTESIDELEQFEDSQPSRIIKFCNFCSKSFKSIKKFLIHKITCHVNKPSRFLKTKLHKRSLGQKNKRRIRNICAQIIKQKNKKAVVKKVNKPKKKKSYVCPTCSKTFHGPKNLYQHKISHADSFHVCNICEKRFKRPHGLKQHIKAIHEQEKTHICPICNYAYLLKADMLRCRHSKLRKLNRS